ncbi:MAG: hypothetical protein AB1646_11725 [Thermodesulfobacteriota bacterium]
MSSEKNCRKAHVCYVRLPPSIRDEVSRLAESEQRPFSTTVRRLVEQGLKAYGNDADRSDTGTERSTTVTHVGEEQS